MTTDSAPAAADTTGSQESEDGLSRSMTAMSPLQFQKRMRLSEARRLMLVEHIDASRAA